MTFHIHDQIGRLTLDITVNGDGTVSVHQLIQDGLYRGHWRDYRLYEDGRSDTGTSMVGTSGETGLFEVTP